MTLRMHIRTRAGTAVRLLSNVLLVGGLSGMAAYVWMRTDAFVYQSVQQHYLEGAPSPVQTEHPRLVQPVLDNLPRQSQRAPWTAWIRPDPAVIGRLEIPRISLSAIIREGTDAQTLRRAVGHLPSTALPGDAGNFVVTGHRDTFFRPLRGILRGDEIRAVTRNHVYVYRVYALSVVSPDDIHVLKSTNRPECTLITCFPFDHIGPSSRRLIVQANLVEQR